MDNEIKLKGRYYEYAISHNSVFFFSCFTVFSSSMLYADQDVQVTPININTADVATLSKHLKGIGEAKAKAIVQYRETVGPFKAVEELSF